jgi:anaerobic magnesium-protoporphyrin IX monomethyl ester cyclase
VKILLINPRYAGGSRNFPLGLGYLASVARAAGHQAEVLDVNALGLADREIEERLQGGKWDVFGLTGLITEYRFIVWLAETIRRLHPDALIVAGGGLASVAPEHLLKTAPIDVAVIGEGEATFPELLSVVSCQLSVGKGQQPVVSGQLSVTRGQELATGNCQLATAFESIRGICYLRNGVPVRTPPREQIEDLDSLPLPAWELFPVDFYLRGPKKLFNSAIRSMNVEATRGCPFNCAFCYKEAWGSRVRRRSVESVVAEIRELKKRFGVQAVAFVDDLLTAKKSWMVEFCERLKTEKLGVSWACNSRVDTMDEELLRLMRQAGCVVVAYGLESGSPAILKAMNKKADVARAEWAVHATRRAGIEVLPYMAMGMPEETPATMAETVEFCRRARIYSRFSIITPLPGSEVFKRAIELGKVESLESLLDHWQHYGSGITVNLTAMSDAELLALKARSERAILHAYLLHGWRHYLRRVWTYWRAFGLRAALQVVLDGARKVTARLLPTGGRAGK